eukprot:7800875-Pyramimonas_sp.AAC.1
MAPRAAPAGDPSAGAAGGGAAAGLLECAAGDGLRGAAAEAVWAALFRSLHRAFLEAFSQFIKEIVLEWPIVHCGLSGAGGGL